MQFRNEEVEEAWNTWVARDKNANNPTDRGAVTFGQRFVELAEAKLNAGGSLSCWKELALQVDEGMGVDGISWRTIEIVLDYVVQAWAHGDELKRSMLG